MTDKATQKRRGFVFVEFTTDGAADKATVETFHTIDDIQVCVCACVRTCVCVCVRVCACMHMCVCMHACRCVSSVLWINFDLLYNWHILITDIHHDNQHLY